MNPFDAASPFDARYYFADRGFFDRLNPYVSENAQVRYLARVEAALAETLADFDVCPRDAAAEIARAAEAIKPEEVYEEERRIQHNIRALVNCIGSKVSDKAKPYVHLFATSADIMDTARALCLADVDAQRARARSDRAGAAADPHGPRPRRHAADGPHARPARGADHVRLRGGACTCRALGQRIESIVQAAANLRGKFAGAVGATTPCRS